MSTGLSRRVLIAASFGLFVGGGWAYAKTPGPDVTVIVTSDKRVYRVGEMPFFRVQLKNWSSSTVSLPAMFARHLVTLNITDSEGNVVPVGGPRTAMYGVRSYHIPPHTLFNLYSDLNRDGTLNVWSPLSDWGYDIDSAGVYSLSFQANFSGEMAKTLRSTRRSAHVANAPPMLLTFE